MLNIYINEYRCTRSELEEMVFAWWMKTHSSKKPVIAAVAVILVLMAVLFITQNENILFALFAAIMVAIIGLPAALLIIAVRSGKGKRREIEAFEAKYGINPKVRVEIDKQIRCRIADKVMTYDLTEIADIINSDQLIIFMMKDGKYIAAKKSGFVEGYGENCLAYVKEQAAL